MGAEGHKHIRQLTQKAQQGNREAFEDLYLKYRSAIRGYVSSRIFDADTIKDIEQATWAWVLEKIDSFDPGRMAFYSFVKYKAIKLIGKHYRRREVPIGKLKARFPDCKTDTEIFDLLTVIDPMQLGISAEDVMIAGSQIAKTLFSLDRPPHQVIAFGFSTLLKYGPTRVVSELSENPLGGMCDRLKLECEEVFPHAQISTFYMPLKRKMRRKVKDMLYDAASRKIYGKLFDKIVGETMLKDYLELGVKKYHQRAAEAKVSDWACKVLKSVRQAFLRIYACGEDENRTS